MSNTAIMKRIAELRPVLPRPPAQDSSNRGPVHIPSSGSVHAHPQRHHISGQAPYEFAYGMTHHHTPCCHPFTAPPNPTFPPSLDQTYAEHLQMMGLDTHSWNSNPQGIELGSLPFPSLCGCGDDCNCPGCLHHNRAMNIPSSSAYASCTNPGTCGTCLDCTIMSLPPSALDDTALSIPNAQNKLVADWLRQLSSSSSSGLQNLPSVNGDFQLWNHSHPTPDMDQGPPFVPPAFHYGSTLMPPYPNDPHRNHRPHSSGIDPRYVPGTMGTSNHPQFFGVADPDPSRSRSPSTSSQSSLHGSEGNGNGLPLCYMQNGRQQGMYSNSQGVRSSGPHGINGGST